MHRALRLFAIALIGLATSAAAAAPRPGSITLAEVVDQSFLPPSLADELKFAKEDPKEVDAVQFVNAYVNANMTYVSDMKHYGIVDLWVMNPPDHLGDCEDYALTKMSMLGDMAGVENSRIEDVIVHDRNAKGKRITAGHAILAYRFNNGSVAYLDLNYPHLMTKAELQARGYEFQNW